ncbi:MAG: hypothetical protein IPH88_19305 [Bacteroidales bacterium]|nr:hypothetical protein [Bacteroidales bacterium]
MNYVMLNEDISRHQKYMDVTAKCMYNVFRQTHLNLDLMYRKQTGQRIDLDLLTAKAEINSVINKLMLTFGAEIYKRNYVGESINFKGTYVKIIRKF